MVSRSNKKIVWLTGATSGIGRALLKKLIERDFFVIATARSEHAVNELVNEYGQDRCFGLVWDISKREEIERITTEITLQFGFIDIAILNAGTCEYVDVKNFSAEMFERVIDTNVNGFGNSLAVALPLLRKAKSYGTSRPYLLGVSSLSTYAALPRAEAYGASKAAITYVLESLRVELFAEGIDVSVINPGFVKTPLTDRNDFSMPFLITPEHCAEYILAGMAKRSYEIAFPGSLRWSLKVLSWLPAWLYVRVAQKMIKQ